MINAATGMRAGERYTVECQDNAHQFPGFFLDGKYYLSPELLTAVGWLEGQQFIYDQLDATGAPVFVNGIAGTIEGLTLTLVEGAALKLHEQAVMSEPGPEDEPLHSDGQGERAVARAPQHLPPRVIWAAMGAAFIVGTAVAHLLTGAHRRAP